jgi:HSP20 family protein
MTIIRRSSSPLNSLVTLRQAVDDLFDDGFAAPRGWGAGQLVKMDVYTTADEFVVEASMPGVSPEQAEITVEGNTLTISGETRSSRQEEEGSAILREISRGSFTRSLTLPAGLEPDKATASFEDGLLTLRIPKAEQVKPRQIKITTRSIESGEAAKSK